MVISYCMIQKKVNMFLKEYRNLLTTKGAGQYDMRSFYEAVNPDGFVKSRFSDGLILHWKQIIVLVFKT